MPDILSQDEIDALLSATGSDDGASEASESTGEVKPTSNRPIVTYDFKHPSRVSKDQTRTLENLHSNLARMMASSFSTMKTTTGGEAWLA